MTYLIQQALPHFLTFYLCHSMSCVFASSNLAVIPSPESFLHKFQGLRDLSSGERWPKSFLVTSLNNIMVRARYLRATTSTTVLLLLLCSCACGSHSQDASLQGEELCVYQSQADCVSAAGEACMWCDGPRQCYPAAGIQELGYGACLSRRKLLGEDECLSIAKKVHCLSTEYCRWCRSVVLDDSCFGTSEALRLPSTIFDCSSLS